MTSGSSAGKESVCNAGDLSLSPGLGRSPGGGCGNPLQYWVSLVIQLVKNLPAMQETWVRSLGQEDTLEEGMATFPNILAWRIPMDRRVWQATVHGVEKSWARLSDFHYTTAVRICITNSLGCTPETNTTLCINYTPIKKKRETHQRILQTLCCVRAQWERSHL